MHELVYDIAMHKDNNAARNRGISGLHCRVIKRNALFFPYLEYTRVPAVRSASLDIMC